MFMNIIFLLLWNYILQSNFNYLYSYRYYFLCIFNSKNFIADFPGMCFASTKCATVEPGKSWELSPFCGRSTCVPAEDDSAHLFELVEDCGPLPKANPKCKLSDKTNKTASFPDCCPIFECEAGAKLEYPEIPTVAPTEIDGVKPADSTAPKA